MPQSVCTVVLFTQAMFKPKTGNIQQDKCFLPWAIVMLEIHVQYIVTRQYE